MLERSEFQLYLTSIDILNDIGNPWLRHYFENKYACYLPGSFNRKGRSPCTNTRLATSSDFTQGLWTPFAMNAMLSLLAGTNEAFSSLCGAQHNFICADYRGNPERIYEDIKKQMLPIEEGGGDTRIFSDNGDGNVGYRIYQVQRRIQDHSKTEYVQVGKLTLDEDGYRFEKTRVDFEEYGNSALPSVCPNKRECDMCFQSSAPTSSAVMDNSSSNGAIVGGMGAAIGVLAAALIAVIIILILCKRRQLKASDGDDYIDALPEGMREFYQTGQFPSDNTGYIAESSHSGDSGIHSSVEAAI